MCGSNHGGGGTDAPCDTGNRRDGKLSAVQQGYFIFWFQRWYFSSVFCNGSPAVAEKAGHFRDQKASVKYGGCHDKAWCIRQKADGGGTWALRELRLYQGVRRPYQYYAWGLYCTYYGVCRIWQRYDQGFPQHCAAVPGAAGYDVYRQWGETAAQGNHKGLLRYLYQGVYEISWGTGQAVTDHDDVFQFWVYGCGGAGGN